MFCSSSFFIFMCKWKEMNGLFSLVNFLTVSWKHTESLIVQRIVYHHTKSSPTIEFPDYTNFTESHKTSNEMLLWLPTKYNSK